MAKWPEREKPETPLSAGPVIKAIRPRSTFCRPSFLRPSGGSERVEPDDVAREICRYCAAAELREGNTALPLTSPCYNAIRCSFPSQPLHVDPPRRHPTTTGVSF